MLAFLLALGLSALPAQNPALKPEPGVPVPGDGWTREIYSFESKLLGEKLRLFVAKPPSFARSKIAYPVLYLLDGQYYFLEAESVLASLVEHGHVPEMILVGIESKDRRVDFSPKELELPDVGDRARAGTYLDFLEHELLPAVESQLRAGLPRVLMGHSHGGILALYAISQRPAVFPWVVPLDAPAHHADGFLARELLRTLNEERRPALRIVTRKCIYGWSDEQWGQLQHAARPGDVLRDGKLSGEAHETMFFDGCYQALHELFEDSSALRTRDLSPLEFEELYRGLALTPSEMVLHRLVEDFLLEGRGVHAGAWLERYVAAYGKPDDYAELDARVKAAQALGEPTETVASLLALPRATPAEMKAHLGAWKGWDARGEGPHSSVTVVFRVVDGAVQGELELEQGPKLTLEYIRFRLDGALEFGFKNGMRPRGLIMYTEKVPGGPLEGEIVFRGMRFTLPPGEEMPPAHFELQRMPEGEAKKDSR